MDSRATRFTLIQIRDAIELSNGPGVQQTVRVAMPPFSTREAKARLEAVLANPSITTAERDEAHTLQQLLREKFGL